MTKKKISVPPEEKIMSSKVDYDEVRKLIALLEEKNLTHFELEVEGFKIKIGRNIASPAGVPAMSAVSATPAPPEPENSVGTGPVLPAGQEKNLNIVTSPMVGTFYRAPAPNADPFVEIGDTVTKGQTLCIIEAMKLMNEIETEIDGVVAEIWVENGKPVEFGQRLFTIQPPD